MTVNSSSVTGDVSDLSVINPTGLNTSPFLNPKPGLVISKDLTSKRVDPIPVVLLPPTSMFRSNPVPVSVVAPTPILDTPVTGKFSYLGDGASILGLIYPVPPPTTLNTSVPPIPTVAVTVAPVPTPPPDPTPTVNVFVVVVDIDKVALCAGSVVLGYGWSVANSSLLHLNVRDSVAIPIVFETVNPWFGIVRIIRPVKES